MVAQNSKISVLADDPQSQCKTQVNSMKPRAIELPLARGLSMRKMSNLTAFFHHCLRTRLDENFDSDPMLEIAPIGKEMKPSCSHKLILSFSLCSPFVECNELKLSCELTLDALGTHVRATFKQNFVIRINCSLMNHKNNDSQCP